MPRTSLFLATVDALIYFALCLALFLAQRSFIYYPQTKSTGDNGSTLTLNVDGERILVATRPRDGSDAVIYFGGNAEDVSHSLPTLADAFPERSLYAMNYRGYRGSTGKPSEAALIADKHSPQSLATLTVIPAVGHNTISESPEYIPLLRGMR